jgi:TPR repeat protein
MRIRTGSSCRDRRTSILGSVGRRFCLRFAALLFIAVAAPARAGWDGAHAAMERGDYTIVFEELLPLAHAGDPTAQTIIGFLYVGGEGVAQDYAEAVMWFRRAAEQGNADAQYNLGVSYANGHGVLEDDIEAVEWYRRAAEQGSAHGQFGLGFMYA